MAAKKLATQQDPLREVSQTLYDMIDSLDENSWEKERTWVTDNVMIPLDEEVIQPWLATSSRDRMSGTVKQRKQGLKKSDLPYVECTAYDMRGFGPDFKMKLENDDLPKILATCLGTTQTAVADKMARNLRSKSEIAEVQNKWSEEEGNGNNFAHLHERLATMRNLDLEYANKEQEIIATNARTLLVAQLTSYFRSHVLPFADGGGNDNYSHDAYYPPVHLFRKFSDVTEQEDTAKLKTLIAAWEKKNDGQTFIVRGARYLSTLEENIWAEFDVEAESLKKGKSTPSKAKPGGIGGAGATKKGAMGKKPPPSPGRSTPSKKPPASPARGGRGRGGKAASTPKKKAAAAEPEKGEEKGEEAVVNMEIPLMIDRPVSHNRPKRDASTYDYNNTAGREVHIIETPNVNEDNDDPYISVACRIRPLMAHEQNSENCVEALPNGSSLQLLKAAKNKKVTSFDLHYVADMQTNQVDFYDQCRVKPLFDKALQGQYVTMFAYGQTGSGKTYSIAGPEDVIALHERVRLQDPDNKVPEPVRNVLREILSNQLEQQGVMPRGTRYIFDRIVQMEEENPNLRYNVTCSYVEIYNENLYDLLGENKDPLEVKMLTGEREGFYTAGLTERVAEHTDDVMTIFMDGARNRQVASHLLNRESSRSHALFSMTIDRCTWDSDGNSLLVDRGKVTLVDLAGSESVKSTQTAGTGLRETQGINTSLLHLSNIVSGIAKDGIDGEHIPWRNSKLTMLLMESLANVGTTLMLANISPAGIFVAETTNTLTFATKAANIMGKQVKITKVQSNPEMDALRAEAARQRHRVQDLEAEVARLAALLDRAGVSY